MSDPFRASLGAAPSADELARARRRQLRRAERAAMTQAALASPAGRAFLAGRLADETAAAPWRPGDTLDACAFRAGRVALLRELLAELDEPTTPTQGS